MTVNEEMTSYEGQMFRKTEEDPSSTKDVRLKAYFYRLVGKELYAYKKENSDKHRVMHNLVGVFVKDVADEMFDSKPLFSF